MIDPLPTLNENQIVIDVDSAIATASFVFADGFQLPTSIGWETLREWAVASRAFEIKAAILEHYDVLAPLAAQARASGETFLILL